MSDTPTVEVVTVKPWGVDGQSRVVAVADVTWIDRPGPDPGEYELVPVGALVIDRVPCGECEEATLCDRCTECSDVPTRYRCDECDWCIARRNGRCPSCVDGMTWPEWVYDAAEIRSISDRAMWRALDALALYGEAQEGDKP